MASSNRRKKQNRAKAAAKHAEARRRRATTARIRAVQARLSRIYHPETSAAELAILLAEHYQGVPVATLPNSQAPGFFANIAQGPQVTASQITAPSGPPASASLAPPYPVASPNRGAPARNPSARPEADSGLDGWLVQRLFGGR